MRNDGVSAPPGPQFLTELEALKREVCRVHDLVAYPVGLAKGHQACKRTGGRSADEDPSGSGADPKYFYIV